MKPLGIGRGSFLHLFGSAVVSQAVVSLANLLVGLILIRHQSDEQYGYYVLVTAALVLLTGVQVGFLQPPMIIRLGRFDESARRDMIGGLFREQRRISLQVGGLMAVLVATLWALNVLSGPITLLVLAGVMAAMATLYREFFRMVLLGHRRPVDVLLSDSVYVVFLVCGALAAIRSPLPAATAVLTLAVATTIGGTMLARAMWRHERWRIEGAPGILRDIAPIGAWSVSGSMIHWVFNQGYTYLVAMMLDVHAVAAIAATRLLVMPLNLLSQGVFQIMLPTASKWFHDHGAAHLYRRLLIFCGGLTLMALCYFGVMWSLRDWIFAHVLKKQFEHRDMLLALWSLVFLFVLLRDQFAPLLVAASRLPEMTVITAVSATLALATIVVGARHFGTPGALAGVLVGETINVIGVVVLARIEGRRAKGHAS